MKNDMLQHVRYARIAIVLVNVTPMLKCFNSFKKNLLAASYFSTSKALLVFIILQLWIKN